MESRSHYSGKEEPDLTKRLLFLLVLMLILALGVSCVRAESEYSLPIALVPGKEPNPACYTKDTYHDDSLDVRMEQVIYNKVRVNLAWITVKSPTQLRTAIAGRAVDVYQEVRPGKIVHAYNAVVAVNGDLFTRREGIIYREGVAIKQTESPNKDSLFIDENGDFHIIVNSDPAEMVEYLNAGHKMINTFSFGPGLIIDGEVQQIRSDYWFEPEGRSQRTAICQTGELSYLFVEVIGRTNESRGFTMQQLADFLGTLGCVQQAYNLDGGDSTVMYFGGMFWDRKYHYEGMDRVASDIVYVATAVDPESWK